MQVSEIAAVIRQELERRGTNAYRAAVDAGLPQNAIRSVLRGREPGSERLAEICRALQLEFYVGPPRGHQEKPSETPESSADDPQWVDRLHAGLQELKAQLAVAHEDIKALRRQIGPQQEPRPESPDAPAVAGHTGSRSTDS